MQYDPVTGLYYGRARWYSTSLGRWISQDPAGYVNGANAYQFVIGDPVGMSDPFGLACCDAERAAMDAARAAETYWTKELVAADSGYNKALLVEGQDQYLVNKDAALADAALATYSLSLLNLAVAKYEDIKHGDNPPYRQELKAAQEQTATDCQDYERAAGEEQNAEGMLSKAKGNLAYWKATVQEDGAALHNAQDAFVAAKQAYDKCRSSGS